MRRLLIVFALVLLPVVALAADGHQAKFTIEYKMASTATTQNSSSAKDGGNPPAMPGMSMGPVTGQLWWTENNLRMETVMPSFGPQSGDSDTHTTTVLYDNTNQVMYMLDESAKQAMKMDLKEAMGGPGGGPGMMGANPANLINGDWDEMLAKLKSTSGATVKDLGATTLEGLSCHHYSFSIERPAGQSSQGAPPEKKDSEDKPKDNGEKGKGGKDPGMGGFMGASSGEIWVADELNMPIRFSTSMMGMSVVYQLSDIKAWTASADFFSVPDGYKTVSMDEAMKSHSGNQRSASKKS